MGFPSVCWVAGRQMSHLHLYLGPDDDDEEEVDNEEVAICSAVKTICCSYSVLGFLLLWWCFMTKTIFRRKGFYLAYTSTALFIIERSQDRKSHRAEAWRSTWCSDHGGVLCHDSLLKAYSVCLLIEPRTTCSGGRPDPQWSSPISH